VKLGEAELTRLGDDELIEYAVGRRESGDAEEAKLALMIFAFGIEGPVRAFVRNKLDSHPNVVVDEIAERALEDAVRSIGDLRGGTGAEARGFVFKIARLRIIDFHRKGKVDTTPLEDLLGDGDAGPRGTDGEDDLVGTWLLIEEALGEMRPDHRAVVELFVLSGHPARETATIVQRRFPEADADSMSEQNVHQIGSRFRKDLRARLELAKQGAVGR
jgi:DNA-directed RNA polymerase specialized sigma24 family protein